MKVSILFVALALGFLMPAWADTNSVPDSAEQDRMFMEGVLLYHHGQYGEAEVRFKRLSELQPNQPTIKQFLADVEAKLSAHEPEPTVVMKKRLQKTIIPEVSFREANPVDVMEFLRTESKKYAPDNGEFNYVWLVPEGTKMGQITLHLRSVPLEDVIRYVAQMSGLSYRIEAHAVVVYKPEPPQNVKSE